MPQPAQNGLALPTIYLLLAAAATAVQWNKWQALHRERNLIAFVISLLILVLAASYLWQAFRGERSARKRGTGV